MPINLFLIPFILFLGLFFGQKDSRRNRRAYILLCSVIFLLVASLRNPEWMSDTYDIDSSNYQYIFESTRDLGWLEFFQSLFARSFFYAEDIDIGYLTFNKIVSLITGEFWAFSLLADLLFFIPFGLLLDRYGTSMSQLIFAAVFYISMVQVYLWTGTRQMFAIGLDMAALLALLDGKRLRAIVFFLLGVTIHLSSLLFLFPLLLIWLDTRPGVLKTLHVVSFLSFPVVILFVNQLISYMGGVMGSEKFSAYGEYGVAGGGTTFLFLMEALSLFCLLAIRKKDMGGSRPLRAFYTVAPFYTLFAPLIISSGSMIRISLYFFVYNALLIPFAIDTMFRIRGRSLAYVLAIGLLSILSLARSNIDYYFFWQQ